MWDFLRPVGEFLNRSFLGGPKIGTLLACVAFLVGVWLLVTSGAEAVKVVLGSFLIAVAAGYFWVQFGRRTE